MAEAHVKVGNIHGQVTATNALCQTRVLKPGDVLAADEVVHTADGSKVELVMKDGVVREIAANQKAKIDSEVAAEHAPDQKDSALFTSGAEIQSVVNALQTGKSLDHLLEATAAGVTAADAAGKNAAGADLNSILNAFEAGKLEATAAGLEDKNKGTNNTGVEQSDGGHNAVFNDRTNESTATQSSTLDTHAADAARAAADAAAAAAAAAARAAAAAAARAAADAAARAAEDAAAKAAADADAQAAKHAADDAAAKAADAKAAADAAAHAIAEAAEKAADAKAAADVAAHAAADQASADAKAAHVAADAAAAAAADAAAKAAAHPVAQAGADAAAGSATNAAADSDTADRHAAVTAAAAAAADADVACEAAQAAKHAADDAADIAHTKLVDANYAGVKDLTTFEAAAQKAANAAVAAEKAAVAAEVADQAAQKAYGIAQNAPDTASAQAAAHDAIADAQKAAGAQADAEGSATDAQAAANSVNDIATVTNATAAVTEDTHVTDQGLLTASGTVTVHDVNTDKVIGHDAAGTYGIFSINDNGNWTYQLDNNNPAVQALGAGNTIIETFTVTSADGAAHNTVAVTINGTDDAPVISSATAAVTEDTTPSVSGTLTATDVDNPELAFNAGTQDGAYGSLTVNADGTWNYTLGEAAQALAAGEKTAENFTVTLNDGSTTTVQININGTNDVPTMSSATTALNGAVTEDTNVTNGMLTTGGTITVTDVDAGQSAVQAQSNVHNPNGYGTFSIDANGNWTYQVANNNTAVQALGANSTPLTETFTVTSADGTVHRDVTVTINGTNEAPVVTNQTLIGTDGNNTLSGGDGNDFLSGGKGADLLLGGAGDDTFQLSADGTWSGGYVSQNVGSPGHAGSNETVSLSGMNQSYDRMDGGTGNDTLLGTTGNDEIVLDDAYSASPDGSNKARFTSIETIDAGDGNDIVDLTSTKTGFAYGDVTIKGGAGNDVLWSSSGNDTLDGGINNDKLDGGWGNDKLIGGAGNDTLTGGAGKDVFVWSLGDKGTPGTPAQDVITDFNKSEDKIDLRDLLQGAKFGSDEFEHDGSLKQGGGHADSGNIGDLLKYINVTTETSGGQINTVLHISSSGQFDSDRFLENGVKANAEDQRITLSNVNLTAHGTGEHAQDVDQTQTLLNMLKNGNLNVD